MCDLPAFLWKKPETVVAKLIWIKEKFLGNRCHHGRRHQQQQPPLPIQKWATAGSVGPTYIKDSPAGWLFYVYWTSPWMDNKAGLDQMIVTLKEKQGVKNQFTLWWLWTLDTICAHKLTVHPQADLDNVDLFYLHPKLTLFSRPTTTVASLNPHCLLYRSQRSSWW